MKEEIKGIAEDVIIGFTKVPLNSELETAIVLGAEEYLTLEGPSRRIAMYLNTNGHFAEIVDSAKEGVDIKRLATSAGLGSIGKSSLVITPEFGPRARFSVILTDALIEPDAPHEFDFCDGCNECTEACPAGAITDSGYNKSVCEHQRGNVCVLCIEACPVGEDR